MPPTLRGRSLASLVTSDDEASWSGRILRLAGVVVLIMPLGYDGSLGRFTLACALLGTGGLFDGRAVGAAAWIAAALGWRAWTYGGDLPGFAYVCLGLALLFAGFAVTVAVQQRRG